MSDYNVRINRALNYAQEKLPGHVELEEVAKIAAFSPYYFHRVFLLVVGENFSQFMRKRRLEWAAIALLKTQSRIIDIALDAGFESQEAFSRAFKNYFDITPAKFRKVGSGPQATFLSLMPLFNSEKGAIMQAQLIEKEGFELIGLAATYDTPDFQQALAQWAAFKQQSQDIDTPNSGCFYGVTLIPTSTRQQQNCCGEFKYLTAYQAHAGSPMPAGMTRMAMPKQKYAKYTFKGSISGFQAFIKNVWTQYLPSSGLEVVEAPEIEVYDQRFNLDSHDSEMDYLVPVK